jgi:hypothetical protein
VAIQVLFRGLSVKESWAERGQNSRRQVVSAAECRRFTLSSKGFDLALTSFRWRPPQLVDAYFGALIDQVTESGGSSLCRTPYYCRPLCRSITRRSAHAARVGSTGEPEGFAV